MLVNSSYVDDNLFVQKTLVKLELEVISAGDSTTLASIESTLHGGTDNGTDLCYEGSPWSSPYVIFRIKNSFLFVEHVDILFPAAGKKVVSLPKLASQKK